MKRREIFFLRIFGGRKERSKHPGNIKVFSPALFFTYCTFLVSETDRPLPQHHTLLQHIQHHPATSRNKKHRLVPSALYALPPPRRDPLVFDDSFGGCSRNHFVFVVVFVHAIVVFVRPSSDDDDDDDDDDDRKGRYQQRRLVESSLFSTADVHETPLDDVGGDEYENDH